MCQLNVPKAACQADIGRQFTTKVGKPTPLKQALRIALFPPRDSF